MSWFWTIGSYEQYSAEATILNTATSAQHNLSWLRTPVGCVSPSPPSILRLNCRDNFRDKFGAMLIYRDFVDRVANKEPAALAVVLGIVAALITISSYVDNLELKKYIQEEIETDQSNIFSKNKRHFSIVYNQISDPLIESLLNTVKLSFREHQCIINADVRVFYIKRLEKKQTSHGLESTIISSRIYAILSDGLKEAIDIKSSGIGVNADQNVLSLMKKQIDSKLIRLNLCGNKG